jgi:hypothetical protein
MSDDEQRDSEHNDNTGGINVSLGDKRVRIGKDESKTILGYTGNAWRAVVWAIAYAVAVIATFFAMSLTQ